MLEFKLNPGRYNIIEFELDQEIANREEPVFSKSVNIIVYTVNIKVKDTLVGRSEIETGKMTSYFERGGTTPNIGEKYFNYGVVTSKWSDDSNIYIVVAKNLKRLAKYGDITYSDPRTIEERAMNRAVMDSIEYAKSINSQNV